MSTADGPTLQGATRVPWSFRLFRRLPWRTSVTGMLIGLLLLAVVVGLELLSGRPQALLRGVAPVDAGCEYLPGDYRIAVVGIIALAFSMAARYKLTDWTHDAAETLGSPHVPDAETLAASRPWGVLPGLIGIAICLGFAVDIAERGVEWTRTYWIFPHVHNWGWCLPFGWVGGRLIYSIIANAMIVSRIAKGITIRSLDETTPVDAAVRHGSRSALISLMFLGIISVHFIDPGLNVLAIAFLVVLALLGASISALPAVGVVQCFDDKRDAELKMIRDEIAIEEQQLLAKDADYEPGRIGDLVTMEKRLASWSVSIFRFSALVRLALYVVIGFLSWLGAAAVSVVVENLVRF